MSRITFIGFGELGAALADRLHPSGRHRLSAWTRPRSHQATALLQARLDAAGVSRQSSLEAALRSADVVLCVVPGSAALELAERCASFAREGLLYVDLTTAAVADKEAAAAVISQGGGSYVDAAVLGTVAVAAQSIPVVASGPRATEWAALVEGEGVAVEPLVGPPGQATKLKLLRSVYMKGRDALIVETMLAARRSGLEQRLAESIAGPAEQVSFGELADRTLRSLAVHAQRRAEELRSASDVVLATSVEPTLSRAGAKVLQRVADAGLREHFGEARPGSGAKVLEVLDEATGPRSEAVPRG